MCAQVNESEILHGILSLEMQILNGAGEGRLQPLPHLYLGLWRPGQRPGQQEGWGGQHGEHSILHSIGAEGGNRSSHLEGGTGIQRKRCGLPGEGSREEVEQPRAPSITLWLEVPAEPSTSPQ